MDCPNCGQKMRFVPAGISKKGKRYSAFYVCDNCGTTKQAQQQKTIGTRHLLAVLLEIRDILKEIRDQRSGTGEE